jgi:hypothetical protein
MNELLIFLILWIPATIAFVVYYFLFEYEKSSNNLSDPGDQLQPN